MNDRAFQQQVDEIFLAIEQSLEKANPEIDFESNEGILTITFPSGAQLVLSRQSATQEIWLASPQGAYHFSYQQGWKTKQGQAFLPLLTQIIQEEGNTILSIDPFPFKDPHD